MGYQSYMLHRLAGHSAGCALRSMQESPQTSKGITAENDLCWGR